MTNAELDNYSPRELLDAIFLSESSAYWLLIHEFEGRAFIYITIFQITSLMFVSIFTGYLSLFIFSIGLAPLFVHLIHRMRVVKVARWIHDGP